MTNDGDDLHQWRRKLVAIGLALAFGMGYFFGSILTGLGLPPSLHGPVVAIMALCLFAYMHHDRTTGGPDETER